MAAEILEVKQEKTTESICRLCLMEPEHSRLIFVEEFPTLDGWIENLTSLKIMKIPHAPASLCMECENTLNSFESFREMCFTNDRLIKEMFTQDDSMNDRSDVPKSMAFKNVIEMNQSEDQQPGIKHFTNASQVDKNDITIVYQDIKIEDTSSLNSEENYDVKNEENGSIDNTGEVMKVEMSKPCADNISQEEKLYACSFCDEGFTNSNSLKTHLQNHAQERSHKCEVCAKSFITRSNLKRHMRTHSGVKLYSCNMCPATYSQSFDLSRHIQVHSKVGFPSPTNIAEENKLSHNSSLRQLMQTHSDLEPCSCDLCQANHSDVGGHTQVHLEQDLMRTKGNAKENKPSHTVQEIRKSESLLTPLEAKSKKKLCTICNKYVFRLNKHLVIHSETRPYQCEYCSKGFNQKYKLTTHIRRHTKEKPYVCIYCDKRFPGSANLKIHIRSHTQEKPYKCKDCGKSFITSGHLQRHGQTHSGLKPYPCDMCQSKFSRNSHLVRHKERVHLSKLSNTTAVTVEGNESNCGPKEDENI